MRILICFLGVILVLIGYLCVFEPQYTGAITLQEDIKVFAHRGFGNHAPDNSIEGARIAIARGLDGVDVDAQFTKDRHIVIFHDVSLERFTTGEGRVDSYTLEELATYDMSEKYTGENHSLFSDVRMRTFEDFVREITQHASLMVELKVATAKDTGIEREVRDVLERYNAYDKVLISSFNPVVLYRLKKLEPRIRTVFIFMDSGWDPKRVAETKEEDRVSLPWYLRNEYTRTAIRKLIKPDALSINQGVDDGTIEKLQKNEWPIFIWPTNTEGEILSALSRHPYGLVSDEPELAKKLRDESR